MEALAWVKLSVSLPHWSAALPDYGQDHSPTSPALPSADIQQLLPLRLNEDEDKDVADCPPLIQMNSGAIILWTLIGSGKHETEVLWAQWHRFSSASDHSTYHKRRAR